MCRRAASDGSSKQNNILAVDTQSIRQKIKNYFGILQNLLRTRLPFIGAVTYKKIFFLLFLLN